MIYKITVNEIVKVGDGECLIDPRVIWEIIKPEVEHFHWAFGELNVDLWPHGIKVGAERLFGAVEESKQLELFSSSELESIFEDIFAWSDTEIRGWDTRIERKEITWHNWDISLEMYWDWIITTKNYKILERITSIFQNYQIVQIET